MKKTMLIITLSILLILTNWLQWDIISQITIRYNSLISGLFYYAILAVEIFIIIYVLILNVRNIILNFHHSKISAILPAVIFVFIFTLQFGAPFTNTYAKFNYQFNKYRMEKVIAMLEGKDEMKLSQINSDTYVLPLNLRILSHNAKVITERNENTLKVMFHIHKGIKNSAIVYESGDKQKLKNGDFNLQYDKITVIDTHWYLVKY